MAAKAGLFEPVREFHDDPAFAFETAYRDTTELLTLIIAAFISWWPVIFPLRRRFEQPFLHSQKPAENSLEFVLSTQSEAGAVPEKSAGCRCADDYGRVVPDDESVAKNQ